MNKSIILLILIVACVTAYFTLQHFNLLPQVTGPLNNITTQISGYLEEFNTFIKNNTWFTPVMAISGSAITGGIIKWLSNRSEQQKISTLSNQAIQTQNDMTQSFQKSFTNVTDLNKTLQTQLNEANTKLASVPNVSELQTAYTQQEEELKNWKFTVQTLQAELDRQKINVKEITYIK